MVTNKKQDRSKVGTVALAKSLSPTLRRYRHPGLVAMWFVNRRTRKPALVIGVLFSIILAVKANGIATAYPTVHARAKLAITFGNNIGLKALFGSTSHLTSFGGFIAWNMLSPMLIIGSIWVIILSSKIFRGEEDTGRTELFRSGQTTATRSALATLYGLALTCLLQYACMAVLFIAIGRLPHVRFSATAMAFFALTVECCIVMFMCISALTSQLLASRADAAKVAAGVFGVSLLVRMMADITSLSWLNVITPLGWIEKLQPLYDPRLIWLLPIIVMIGSVSAVAVILAGRRDLNGSIIGVRATGRSHTNWLNNPLQASIKLTRTTNLSWLVALLAVAGFFGFLTKSAADAIGQSVNFGARLSQITDALKSNNALLFLTIVYFLIGLFVMVYAANAVIAIRNDEASGVLDNFLVRPVGRLQLLWGRLAVTAAVIVIIAFAASLMLWATTHEQHLTISLTSLLSASVNIIAPVIFTLGLGICGMAFLSRQTSIVIYGSVTWAFLITILSSGISLNHWILDTSILKQLSAVPSMNPDWTVIAVMTASGCLLAVIGCERFLGRDIVTE
jgi:ABC-2 type transport system permease protein